MKSPLTESQRLLEYMALMRSAHEEERCLAARRLHDEAGQAMAAFRMKCYLVESRMSDGDPGAVEELNGAMTLLEKAISSVREISDELRPGVLQFGIDAAIEWQAEQFQSQNDIACVAEIGALGRRLDEPRAVELFRIFQETLATAKHQGASLVDVKLHEEQENVLLEVTHNGQPDPAKGSRYALSALTIQERAHRTGGRATIAGSTIAVRIPFEQLRLNGHPIP
jgi:two-component system sensor histidine kinase UhpB